MAIVVVFTFSLDQKNARENTAVPGYGVRTLNSTRRNKNSSVLSLIPIENRQSRHKRERGGSKPGNGVVFFGRNTVDVLILYEMRNG